MWPLTGAQVVEACGGRCDLAGLDDLFIEVASVGDVAPAPGQLFVALEEGPVDGHTLVAPCLQAGASLALVGARWPGRAELAASLRARCIVVDDTLGAYRSLAATMRGRFPFPVLAVAGSNGKTSTKELLAGLLRSAGLRVSKTPQTMNGFSGLPYTICQPQHRRGEPLDALVVEIGIDAPGAMAKHAALVAPDVAAITALAEEHLDLLGSREKAAAEELLLFGIGGEMRRVLQASDPHIRRELPGLRAGDVVVCRDRDETSAAQAATVASLRELPGRGVGLLGYRVAATAPTATEVELSWHPAAGSTRAPWRGAVTLPAGGAHNADNLAVAFASALTIVDAPERLTEGARGYASPSMRCQVGALRDGRTLIDDCYNASPASMRAVFELLEAPAWRHRPKVLVLGDMLDLGDASEALHRDLLKPLLRAAPARLCLYGSAMGALFQQLASKLPAVARLSKDADPCAFVRDFPPGLDDAVVLVKGSRGMALERVVAALREQSLAAAAANPRVVVAGFVQRDVTARLLAAALGRAGCSDVLSASLDDLARGAQPSAAAVLSDFEVGAAVELPAERQLALMAQPFMHLPAGGVAVLDAAEETSELIAEVVARGASVIRHRLHDEGGDDRDGGVGADAGPREQLVARLRPLPAARHAIDLSGELITEGGASLSSPAIELPAGGERLARPAIAAFCAAVALGEPADEVARAIAAEALTTM